MFARRLQSWPAKPWWLYAVLILGALLLAPLARFDSIRGATLSGGCEQSANSLLQQVRAGRLRRISFCSGGDADIGTLTASFPKGVRAVDLEVAGYTPLKNIEIKLEADHRTSLALIPPPLTGQWAPWRLLVPREFSEVPFRIVAVDHSTQKFGWIGLAIRKMPRFPFDVRTLAWALVLLAMLNFFGTEICAYMARTMNPTAALLSTLVTIGILSMASFWAYFTSRALGETLSASLGALLVAHRILRARSSEAFAARNLQACIPYIQVVTTLTLCIFIAGLHPFGNGWDTWQMPAARWSQLSIDNWLPKIFADQLWSGGVLHPMVGDWLSSDRPPLQAGYYLLFKPLQPDSAGLYQLTSMWLQSTVIIPLALLLPALGIKRQLPVAMMALSFSAVVVMNDLFVWPKLIAAAFTAVFYLAMTFDDLAFGSRLLRLVLGGFSLSLAMLSHGGAFFSLLGIVPALLLAKRMVAFKDLLLAGLLALGLYAPWVFYQHFVDPPGTRLMIWHLAGVIHPQDMSLFDNLKASYAAITFVQWMQARQANLSAMFSDTFSFFSDTYRLAKLDRPNPHVLLSRSFRSTAYSQWFFSAIFTAVLLPIGMLRRSIPRHFAWLLMATLLALAGWCLLIFEGGETVIHQGGYFTTLSCLLLSMAMVHAVSERVFQTFAWLNVSYFLVVLALDVSRPEIRHDMSYPILLAAAGLLHYLLCRRINQMPAELVTVTANIFQAASSSSPFQRSQPSLGEA